MDTALLCALILLAAGELLCRTGVIAQPSGKPHATGPAQGYYPAPHIFDANRGYRYRPAHVGRFVRRDFETRMTTNAWGFRDDQMTLKKNDGVFRVALLGDSMLAANEVPVDQTWSNCLRKIVPDIDGRPVEFLNFGIDGYLLWNMAGLLDDVAPRFKPDLVVLWVTPRNLSIGLPRYRAVTSHNEILESPDAKQLQAAVRLENRRWESIRDWIGHHSRLGDWLMARCGKAPGSNLRRIAAPDEGVTPYDPMQLVERMRRASRDAGADFVILLREGHSADESPVTDNAIPVYCDAGTIQNFDDLRWPHDAHFNPKGHQRYAQAIAPVMRKIVKQAMQNEAQTAAR